MKNQYYLFLVFAEENYTNFLSNKQLINIANLETIDDFTSSYQDAQELGEELNHNNKSIQIANAIIISEYEYQKLKKNNWEHLSIKTIPVLFQEDIDFFKQQTKDEITKYYYDKQLIEQYKNYLFNHRREISTSLVQTIKLGIDIDASITTFDMNRVFLAYYKKQEYRKMRDTYLELKKIGVIKVTKRGKVYKKEKGINGKCST